MGPLKASKSTRSWFGNVAFLAFALAQACDGICTYLGIMSYGVGIEGNPLVAWYAAAFGIGVSVVAVKLFAVACGAVLHLNAMHRTVGSLSIVYAIVAVWPWTRVLAQM
jgi:hypothetical protein